MAPSATPPLGLLDLPADVLELILVAVADPWSLRSVSLTCRRMAAATAPASPFWRTLLAANVDLTPLPAWPTEWETDFYCYWDGTYGDETDQAAFDPPLARVAGWTGGALPAVPAAAVERALAEHEAAPVAPGEAEEFGDLTRDGGMISWGRPSRDDEPPEPEAAAVERPPVGSFLYVDNRSRGAGVAAAGAPGGPGAASADDAGAPPREDDPRTLYTGLATLSRAAAAVQAADQFKPDCGWGSEGSDEWHLLAVRVHPGSLPWPSAGAPDAAAVAAADALMAAAGADAHARATIDARGGGVHANLAAGGGWSGRPAGETVRRLIAGPWLRHLMGLARNRYLLSRWQWSPRMRPTHAAAFAALDALLGERPLLAFHFGHDVMNPTGGVLAVQWSPSLVLGVLVPVIHT